MRVDMGHESAKGQSQAREKGVGQADKLPRATANSEPSRGTLRMADMSIPTSSQLTWPHPLKFNYIHLLADEADKAFLPAYAEAASTDPKFFGLMVRSCSTEPRAYQDRTRISMTVQTETGRRQDGRDSRRDNTRDMLTEVKD